jgi:hypothetical protein
MTTTKNSHKATAIRGHSRLYLVEGRTGRRMEIIEVKPGARVEEIDTRLVAREDSVSFEVHFSAWKVSARDGIATPGWYFERKTNSVGPFPTKREALRQMRLILDAPDYTRKYWNDTPSPQAAEEH